MVSRIYTGWRLLFFVESNLEFGYLGHPWREEIWVSENEPMISVFSNRIEILSRGTLPPSQTKEGFFLGESVPVNEKLSEIFLQLHISEKSGRGVPKIVETYGREAFTFRENSIVVTIPFNRIHQVGKNLVVKALIV